MRLITDIPYAPQHGQRGNLDLFLPDRALDRPIVIVIHGGALREFSKERVAGWGEFIAEQGYVAVNINYRLLSDAPYPAALQDVLSVFQWIQETPQEEIRNQDRQQIAILGGSAGGFLAMMAGLILGKNLVRAVVSISGPSLPDRFCGPGDDDLDPRLLAAPVELIGPEAPPLLATHSHNDELVRPEESIAMVERMRKMERPADLYLYDGPGRLHGIWRDDRVPLRLYEHIETVIAAFFQKTLIH